MLQCSRIQVGKSHFDQKLANSVRIGTSLRDPLDPSVLASITAQKHHNSDGALRSSPTGTVPVRQRNMNNPTVIINPKDVTIPSENLLKSKVKSS